MFNLTDLLDQLGAHFSLVVIACIELLAAAFLVARAVRSEDNRPVGGRRSAVGKAGENGAEMLRALNFRRFEANLLLRRADMMPLYAVGDLAGLLGLPLESLQEDLAAVLPNMADGEAARSLWKTYQHWDGTAPLHRELQRTDGEWLTVDFRRLQDEDVDLVTIYRSTDLHGRLEQYEHRLQDAEDASQSKTTFLSRMSHEIRTPMNGIIGMLTLAKSRLSADNPAMQYLHKADELSDHLLSLINDILDMSRIEAGKVELEHKPFSLRKLGAKVDVVGDGQQAVDAFNGHGVGYYDFILLDVQMPVMDGRTAARTIRRLPRADAAGIPIFALSADAFVEDERLSAEAGMNGHFAKPVDFTALQHSVGRFLAKKERKTL